MDIKTVVFPSFTLKMTCDKSLNLWTVFYDNHIISESVAYTSYEEADNVFNEYLTINLEVKK